MFLQTAVRRFARAYRGGSPAYTLSEHQARAEKASGRVANKYKFAWSGKKPHMDKKFEECERAWILVDAYGESLGRLAVRVSQLLMGKHKPLFQMKRDVGDHVVIVNAGFIVPGESNVRHKKYIHHTGWDGGLKTTPLWRLFEQNPVEPLRRAIFGMLPKNRLQHQRMSRLRMYPTADHVQEANFRAFDGKAFRAKLHENGRTFQLERILPALESGGKP